MNFQMFELVLEKAEKPDNKLPKSAGSVKKQESSRKISISALLTMPKPLTVWITRNCGTILQEMGIPEHLILEGWGGLGGGREETYVKKKKRRRNQALLLF